MIKMEQFITNLISGKNKLIASAMDLTSSLTSSLNYYLTFFNNNYTTFKNPIDKYIDTNSSVLPCFGYMLYDPIYNRMEDDKLIVWHIVPKSHVHNIEDGMWGGEHKIIIFHDKTNNKYGCTILTAVYNDKIKIDPLIQNVVVVFDDNKEYVTIESDDCDTIINLLFNC